MLTRRSFLAAPAVLKAQPPRRSPNFLFLISDDHAAYVLGRDGNRQAGTPNLDRLAAEGTYFSRCYCNSPVCTPSRQSFLTGRMPHATGVTRLPTPLAPGTPTLADRLRGAGYGTAALGKMHLQQPSAPGLFGFDILMAEDVMRKRWQADVKPKPVPDGIETLPVWRPFKDHARVWLNSRKLPFGRFYDDMLSTYIARQAADFLRERRSAPFALWVSLTEPHSPFHFPVEDRNRFDPSRFSVPRAGPEDAWQVPLIFRDLTGAEKRGIAAAYYTSTAFLDRNIGVVLNALRDAGLEEDTLVVYIGDNGYCLGHHGRFEKHCGYEQALRVPLIFRWPGRIRRQAVKHLVQAADIAPSVLELLGAKPLEQAHGKSLRPYLEGRFSMVLHEAVFSEYLENEEAYLRTTSHKFVYCSGKRRRGDGYETDRPTPGRHVRLFDLEADPGEFTDIAPKRPELVNRFERAMLERFRATHPDAANEPGGLATADALDWYLRPRDERA